MQYGHMTQEQRELQLEWSIAGAVVRNTKDNRDGIRRVALSATAALGDYMAEQDIDGAAIWAAIDTARKVIEASVGPKAEEWVARYNARVAADEVQKFLDESNDEALRALYARALRYVMSESEREIDVMMAEKEYARMQYLVRASMGTLVPSDLR